MDGAALFVKCGTQEHCQAPQTADDSRREHAIQLLLNEVADIRTSDDGTTTLHHSPNVGYMGTVKPLLDQGADIQAADKKEDTALHQFGVRGTHAAT